MFRRTATIFTDRMIDADKARQLYTLEADAIMTAAVLGFTASRFAVGHPVAFSVDPSPQEDPKTKLAELEVAAERINNSLGLYHFDGEVVATYAPEWYRGAMITGAAGSAARPFEQRHAVESEQTATELRELASLTGDASIGYQGRGAYTGFVDDPVAKKPSIKSTMRFNVHEVDDWRYGQRWLPPHFAYLNKENKVIGTNENRAWGLIGGLSELGDGMVQEPFDVGLNGALVGYTHGMIQAIYDCVQRGPWCTPFEIAAGPKTTTKMASCFPCTLLMYAAGFPPSAIHLGRGESCGAFLRTAARDEDAHRQVRADHRHRDRHRQLPVAPGVQAAPGARGEDPAAGRPGQRDRRPPARGRAARRVAARPRQRRPRWRKPDSRRRHRARQRDRTRHPYAGRVTRPTSVPAGAGMSLQGLIPAIGSVWEPPRWGGEPG